MIKAVRGALWVRAAYPLRAEASCVIAFSSDAKHFCSSLMQMKHVLYLVIVPLRK